MTFWNIQSDSKAVALNIKGSDTANFSFNDALMTPN